DPDQVVGTQDRLPRPAVGRKEAILGHAEIQTGGVREEDAGLAAHPIVAEKNRRLVSIKEVRRDALVGKVRLAPFHPKRGGAKCRGIRVPPAQARLVTEMPVLVAEGGAVREPGLRPLEKYLGGLVDGATAVVGQAKALLGQPRLFVQVASEGLLR